MSRPLALWLVSALALGGGCLPDFPVEDDDGADDDGADDDGTPGDDDGADDDGADDDGTPGDDDATSDDDDATSTIEEDLEIVDRDTWTGEQVNHLDFNEVAEGNGYRDCDWIWESEGVRDTSGAPEGCEACSVVFLVSLVAQPDHCDVWNDNYEYWYGLELLGDGLGTLWSRGTHPFSEWVEWCEIALDPPGTVEYYCWDGGSGTFGDGGSFFGEVEGTATLE